MSRRFRLFGHRRWWAVGVIGALLIAIGVAVSPWSLDRLDPTPAGPAASAAPAAFAVRGASAEPSTNATPAPSEPWSAPLNIPADATDDERLQIKMSYDFVSLPVDQLDQLSAVPGVQVVSPRTLGDTAYAAIPAAAADTVSAALPEATVTPNEIVHADEDETPVPSWGLDAVDNTAAAQDDHYLYDSDGTGVTAFVVDSGVQSDHPDFGGRVDPAAGHDEVGDGRGTEDCNGHGTHVAGTIGSSTYGVAKKVRIVPVRVLGCNSAGSTIDVLYGMLWIYQNNDPAQSVINMSLTSSKLQILDNYADGLVDAGFVLAVAAGNSTQDACNYSPASASEPITVGAFDRTKALAWYSNYGSCVDILAPGSDITSTWIGSTINTISGTSMATPHVVGLAARLLQLNPTWGTPEVQAALTSAAATGHISAVPSGTANLVAAISGIPRVASLATAADPAGIALSWTTNRIGTFLTFSIEVTDTTTGRVYPVTVSADRSSTVFTDVISGHAYTVSITASVRMPLGATVTTDAVTAAGP